MSTNKSAAPRPAAGEPSGLTTARSHRWIGMLGGLVLGLVVGWAGAKVWFDGQARQIYDQTKVQLEQALARQKSLLNTVQARLDSVQGQLTVEESTRKGLETTLQDTQDELGRTRDRLAFFDRLLPPGPSGSISVRAFEVEQQGSLLMYRVLLMRNAPDSAGFNGTMQFMAQGLQNGKSVQIELKPAEVSAVPAGGGVVAGGGVASVADRGSPAPSGTAGVSPLTLSFDQFQRSGGALQIPAGFVPKTITLKILEGSALRVSRSVNMPAAE